MMKRLPLIIAVLLVVGCKPLIQSTRSTIPYVTAAVADNQSLPFGLSELYRFPDNRGSIYVIGEPERVLAFGQEFVSADSFNNASGRKMDDLLLDFSGEIISLVLDEANAPYGGYITEDNGDFLRELMVRNVVASLDTTCYVSPYDREGRGRKLKPKMVVFTSTYASVYGKADIDTLLHSVGINIPVVCSFDTMVEKVFDDTEGDIMAGVMSRSGDLSAGLYSSVFQKEAHKRGRHASECVAFSAKGSEGHLRRFADNYLAAGYTRPLDVLMVDDIDVDPDALRLEYKDLISVHNAESLVYGRVFNDGFEIIDCRKCLIDKCYRILRAQNLFAGRIAYPKTERFLTVPVGEFSKYGRVPSASEESTYMLIQYSDRYHTASEDVQD